MNVSNLKTIEFGDLSVGRIFATEPAGDDPCFWARTEESKQGITFRDGSWGAFNATGIDRPGVAHFRNNEAVRLIPTIMHIGPRPEQANNAFVFNAPRPLYGKEWTGDFRHGVFYAAVEMDTPDTATKLSRNLDLDGYFVWYISQAAFDAMVDAYVGWVAVAYNIDPSEFAREDMEASFKNWLITSDLLW